MSLCRCGQARRDHPVTDACLSPEDQEYVRRFIAAYDMADLGPWWLQAAGRDQSQAEASYASVTEISGNAQSRESGEV